MENIVSVCCGNAEYFTFFLSDFTNNAHSYYAYSCVYNKNNMSDRLHCKHGTRKQKFKRIQKWVARYIHSKKKDPPSHAQF